MKYVLMSVCAFLFCQSGFSSIYLYNNTPFVLKAQVTAANGADMGTTLLQPGQQEYVEDQIGSSNPVDVKPDEQFKNYQNSMTPYQVSWFCEEGDIYGSCDTVSAGATVIANACNGPKTCKPKKKEETQSSDAYKEAP